MAISQEYRISQTKVPSKDYSWDCYHKREIAAQNEKFKIPFNFVEKPQLKTSGD